MSACTQTPDYRVLPGATTSDTPDHGKYDGKVVIIGDSSTEGTQFGGQGASNWAAIVRSRLTEAAIYSPLIIDGRGGSGYLTTGTAGTTFVSETDRLITADTTVVVYFGSANDVDAPGDLAAAIEHIAKVIRARAPRSRVIAVGPAWSRWSPYPPRLLENQHTAKVTWERAGATYIDPLAEHWLGNRVGMVGGDGIHPTDRAHRLYADHLYPVIRAALLARPGP